MPVLTLFQKTLGIFASLTLTLTLVSCGGGGGGEGGGGSAAAGDSVDFSMSPAAIEKTVYIGAHTQSATTGFADVSWLEEVYVELPNPRPAWLIDARPTQLNPGSPSPIRGVEAIVTPGYMNRGLNTSRIKVSITGRGSRWVDVRITVVDQVKFDQTLVDSVVVFGSSDMISPIVLNSSFSAGTTTSWSVSSNQSWLTLDKSSGIGPGTIQSTTDASGLALGYYYGDITLQNLDYSPNTSRMTHRVTVVDPQISAPAEIVINGAEGTGNEIQRVLSFSIDTGTAEYPYTLTILNQSAPGGWLSLSSSSGMLSATAASVDVNVDTDSLPPGSHTATIAIDADVNGHMIRSLVPATYNKAEHRVVAAVDGIAFSKLPSRSVLSRSIKVLSSLGATNIPWHAASDQSWLNVTPSGLTGNQLTMTVDPTDLTPDAVYSATITITSSDAKVNNTESIQVGFNYASSDPTALSLDIPSSDIVDRFLRPSIVASPTEPLVYTLYNGYLYTWNINNGVLENSFKLPRNNGTDRYFPGMTISSDGKLLYISYLDFSGPTMSWSVLEVDPKTSTVVRSFSTGSASTPGYIRPAGVPFLVGLGTSSVNLVTGMVAEIVAPTIIEAANLRNTFISHYTLSDPDDPSRIIAPTGDVFSVAYSVVDPQKLFAERLYSNSAASSFTEGACMNNSQSHLIIAYNTFSIRTFPQGVNVQDLPVTFGLPNGLVCSWNGLIIAPVGTGGSTSFNDAFSGDDVYIFDSDTYASLGSLRMAPTAAGYWMQHAGVTLSGDGTRIIGIAYSPDDIDKIIIVDAP